MTRIPTAELLALKEQMTPGPWKWWTSNSWRRLSSVTQEGGVICPYVCRDGHPDLSVSIADAKIIEITPDLITEVLALRALLEQAEAALDDVEETLRLVEHPAFPDPQHHQEVKTLGMRIGFGALMTTASAGWRETLETDGYPVGGEFVSGPCHGTVISSLSRLRTTLAALRQNREASHG